MGDVSNSDDVIDSRDVIARIDELVCELEEADDQCRSACTTCQELRDELEVLRKFAEEGESLSDWEYGETLVRDSYFKEYAQELAEEVGAVDRDAGWPNRCIDWEKAASELRQDYTAIDFGGVTYWGRA